MKEFTQWVKLPVMARLLSRSVKQFRDDVDNYQIPHIKLGRDKLFDPEKVAHHLSEKSPPPAARTVSAQTGTADAPAETRRKIESGTAANDRYKLLLGLA